MIDITKRSNQFLCGDALKILQKMPRNLEGTSFVTSPPYNLKNSTGNGMKDGSTGKWSNAALQQGYDKHSDDMPHEEYVAWQRAILTEAMEIIPEDGAIFYNHKERVQGGLLQTRDDILKGFPLRQRIIWKRAGGINFNPGYFLPTHEDIYLITKPKFKLTPKANKYGTVWEMPQDLNNDHPAPFPLALADRMVSSLPATLIIDPFGGSGTTALAALQNDKEFISIDISEKYCRLARERVNLYSEKNFLYM